MNGVFREDTSDESLIEKIKKFFGIGAFTTATYGTAKVGSIIAPAIAPGTATAVGAVAKGVGATVVAGVGTMGLLPFTMTILTPALAYKLWKMPDKKVQNRILDAASRKALENQEINQYIRALDFFALNLRRSMLGKQEQHAVIDYFTKNKTAEERALSACDAWVKLTRKKPILESLYKQKLEQFQKENDINEYAKWVKYSIGADTSRTRGQETQQASLLIHKPTFDLQTRTLSFSTDPDRDEIKKVMCKESILYYRKYIETLEIAIFLYKLVHNKFSLFLIKNRCVMKDSEILKAGQTSKNLFETARWNDNVLMQKNSLFQTFHKDLLNITEDIVLNNPIKNKEGYNTDTTARNKWGYVTGSDEDGKNKEEVIELVLKNMPTRLLDNEYDCKWQQNAVWVNTYENLVLQQQIPDIALLEYLENYTTGKFKIKGLRDFSEFTKCTNSATGEEEKDIQDSVFNNLKKYVDQLKDIQKNQKYILDSLSEIISQMVDWIQKVEKTIDSSNNPVVPKTESQRKEESSYTYKVSKLSELLDQFIFIEKYITPDELDKIYERLINIVFKTEPFTSYDGKTIYYGADNKQLKRKSIVELEKEIYDFTIKFLIQAPNAKHGKFIIDSEKSKTELDKKISNRINQCSNIKKNINKPWALTWHEKYIPFVHMLKERKAKLTDEYLRQTFEDYKSNTGSTNPFAFLPTTLTTINNNEYYIFDSGKYIRMFNLKEDDKVKYAEKGILYEKLDNGYKSISKYIKQKETLDQLKDAMDNIQDLKGNVDTINNTISNFTNKITLNIGDDPAITDELATKSATEINTITNDTIKWGKDDGLKAINWNNELYNKNIMNPFDVLFFIVVTNNKIPYEQAYNLLKLENNKINDSVKNEAITNAGRLARSLKAAIIKNNDIVNQVFYIGYNEKLNISNAIISSWIDYYVDKNILNNESYLLFILMFYFFGDYKNGLRSELRVDKSFHNDAGLSKIEDDFISKINDYIKKNQLNKYDNIGLNRQNLVDKDFLIQKIYLKHIINIGKDYALKLKNPIGNMYNSSGKDSIYSINEYKPIIEKINPGLKSINEFNKFYKPNAGITQLEQENINKLFQYIKDKGNNFDPTKKLPQFKIQEPNKFYYQLRLAITQWNPSLSEGYGLFADDIKNAKDDKAKKLADKYYEHKDDAVDGTTKRFGDIVRELLATSGSYWAYVSGNQEMIPFMDKRDMFGLDTTVNQISDNVPLKVKQDIAKALHSDFKSTGDNNAHITKDNNGKVSGTQKVNPVANAVLQRLENSSSGKSSFYELSPAQLSNLKGSNDNSNKQNKQNKQNNNNNNNNNNKNNKQGK